MLRVLGKILKEIPDEPIRSPLWAAGFSFSRSTVITEVTAQRVLKANIASGDKLNRRFTNKKQKTIGPI